MTLEEAKKALGELLIKERANENTEILSLCYDSRKASPQSMFVCLVGALSDGHRYIEKAVAAGANTLVVSDEAVYEAVIGQYSAVSVLLVRDTRRALALLSDEFFGHPSKSLFLIGITGTKGKTSTSFMIRAILENAGKAVGVIGTTGIYYGDRYEYIDNSTPESYELHRIFRDMANSGITHVVMEVSSQALMMHRTYGIWFDIGVFTNISPDHIGEHEHTDFEQYLACKLMLFKQCRKAVVNADSDRIADVKAAVCDAGIPLVTYAVRDACADFFGENMSFSVTDSLTTSFDIRGMGRVTVNTPGEFSVYNALAATSVCLAAGADFSDVQKGLAAVHVFGRVEPVRHPKCPFAVIIDYAHNALSLESLYRSIASYHPKRIITVFGCGGNRSKLRRYDMGEIAGRYSDYSVITSDNPRTEKVADIISDILVGMKKTDGQYRIIEDRREAIFHALSVAEKGDIVLLVGKGNQLYEEVGHEKIPFDERLVVKEYFDSLTV